MPVNDTTDFNDEILVGIVKYALVRLRFLANLFYEDITLNKIKTKIHNITTMIMFSPQPIIANLKITEKMLRFNA
jgi:hypothetical protein